VNLRTIFVIISAIAIIARLRPAAVAEGSILIILHARIIAALSGIMAMYSAAFIRMVSGYKDGRKAHFPLTS